MSCHGVAFLFAKVILGSVCFTISTDHHELKGFLDLAYATEMVARWHSCLSSYILKYVIEQASTSKLLTPWYTLKLEISTRHRYILTSPNLPLHCSPCSVLAISKLIYSKMSKLQLERWEYTWEQMYIAFWKAACLSGLSRNTPSKRSK